MEFWKGQALGNDYIVIEAGEDGPPSPPVLRALCDRHRGVGADGVLVADRSRQPVGLRIFNPDGSEAEKSGNGLRIFGAWLHGQGLVAAEPFSVTLPGATVELCVKSAARDGTLRLEVDMGRASFRAGEIPFTPADPDDEILNHPVELAGEDIRIHLVSVGNPHCVVFADDEAGEIDESRFRRLAPDLQRDTAFARGVNVQFARALSGGNLEARIWERGAGETLASGSSACAVAAVAFRTGRVTDRSLDVAMRGGTVRVRIEEDWRLHLTGDAQIVYRGEVPAAVVAGWR